MYIVEVYVTNASLAINHPFIYYSQSEVLKYTRVKVLFNRVSNVGLAVNCEYIDGNIVDYQKDFNYKILPILEVIDVDPIISQELFDLAVKLAKNTFSPLITCINLLVPKYLKTIKKLSLSKKIALVYKAKGLKDLSVKQELFFNALADGESLANARKHSTSITNTLIKNKWLYIVEKDKSLLEEKFAIREKNFLSLNNQQSKAYYDIISSSINYHYLFGVTGSGKTEVYLHLARNYLKLNKQVLILVPEIALTPQMIERVKQRFQPVYFYHSALSNQEKYEQYMAIKNCKRAVVVGTRSAIFLPFSNLGLIVIDEEHDSSYKQETTPSYDARKVALWRANYFSAKVVFASATPSLEYYSYALNGNFAMHKLAKRINNMLPTISIVNTKEEIKNGNSIISTYLKDKISECLKRKEQVIILINRRGYAPIVRCNSCQTTLTCNNCDLALNYHLDEGLLKCHQCGKTYKLPNTCLRCGEKDFSYYGYGTKKVVELLTNLFPASKIGRMDFDNTQRKGSLVKILNALANKEIDILVGTQILAKGLDYPNVTLVGILNADAGLRREDYNASATTFFLLMQAAGRCGRGDKKGEVIIQAFNPNHYVIRAIIKKDYENFYWQEMNYREKANYPPFTHFVALVLSHRNEHYLKDICAYLWQQMENLPLHKYRPLNIGKRSGQYRYRILLRVRSIKSIQNELTDIINNYLNSNYHASIKVMIDPDNME